MLIQTLLTFFSMGNTPNKTITMFLSLILSKANSLIKEQYFKRVLKLSQPIILYKCLKVFYLAPSSQKGNTLASELSLTSLYDLFKKSSLLNDNYSMLLQAIIIRLIDKAYISSDYKKRSNNNANLKLIDKQEIIDRIIETAQLNLMCLRSLFLIAFQLSDVKEALMYIKGQKDTSIINYTNFYSKQTISRVFRLSKLLKNQSIEMKEFQSFIHTFITAIANRILENSNSRKVNILFESQKVFGDIYFNLLQADAISQEVLIKDMKVVIHMTFPNHSNPFYFNWIYRITHIDNKSLIINSLLTEMTMVTNKIDSCESHFIANSKSLIILFYKLIFFTSIEKAIIYNLLLGYVSKNLLNPLIYSKLLYETINSNKKMFILEMIIEMLIDYYQKNSNDYALLKNLLILSIDKEQHTLFYHIDMCDMNDKLIKPLVMLDHIHDYDIYLEGTKNSYVFIYYFALRICSNILHDNSSLFNDINVFLEKLLEILAEDINQYNNYKKKIQHSQLKVKSNDLIYYQFKTKIKEHIKTGNLITSIFIKQIHKEINDSKCSIIKTLSTIESPLNESVENKQSQINKLNHIIQQQESQINHINHLDPSKVERWMPLIKSSSFLSIHLPQTYLIKGSLGVFFKHNCFYNQQFDTTLLDAFNHLSCYDNKDRQFLKYPTKIKNYITQNYMRPFLTINKSFFDNPSFKISHSYIDMKTIDNSSQKHNNKIIIEAFDRTDSVDCDLITIKGTYYGTIYYLIDCLIFESKNNKEMASKYLYSSIDYIYHPKQIIVFYSNIKEVLIRRFLYMWQAVEIFLYDGKSYFINLYKEQTVTKLFDLLKVIQKKSTVSYKLITDIQEHLIRKEYQSQWKNNTLSTFEYLLILNKLSGRSYHDLNQYPIFPWLLKSYNNMNNKQLRLFKYPISAQSEEKRINIMNHYDDIAIMNKDSQIVSHFHIHYSTSAFVYYFLARLEPITTGLIEFQTGKFDDPNRMFHSIYQTKNILEENKDNRELIPEFFYLPEMLINVNYGFFGKRENSPIINNVILPDDCLNEMQMIYKHQNLLNSIYVSKHIHKWIDNIFGSNQLIQNRKSLNVFPEYTYEQIINFKTVNHDKIFEMKSMVLNMGQTPYQLFTQPHSLLLTFQNNEINKVSNNNDNLSSLSDILTKENICSNLNSIKLFPSIAKKIHSVMYLLKHIMIVSSYQICFFKKKDMSLDITIDLDNYFLLMNPYWLIEIENNKCLYYICGNFANKTLRIYTPFQKNNDYSPIIKQTDAFITTIIKGPYIGQEIIIYTGNNKGKITKWLFTPQSKDIMKKEKEITAHQSPVIQIIYSECLQLIISCGEDKYIYMRNIYSFEIINCINIGYQPKSIFLINSMMIYVFGQESSGYTLNGIRFTYSKKEYDIPQFIDNKLMILHDKKRICEINIWNLQEILYSIDLIEDNEFKISFIKYNENIKTIDCFLENCSLKRILINKGMEKRSSIAKYWL